MAHALSHRLISLISQSLTDFSFLTCRQMVDLKLIARLFGLPNLSECTSLNYLIIIVVAVFFNAPEKYVVN